MDTEEYVGNDKLTGPPIRVTHSDHTADLIQVVREKDKHTNKQTKLFILESTAPPQLRISHYTSLLQHLDRPSTPQPTHTWRPRGAEVPPRNPDTLHRVHIHKEENHPDEDIINMLDQAVIYTDPSPPHLAKCYDRTGHIVGTLTHRKLLDL
jgi:hypothetical protein